MQVEKVYIKLALLSIAFRNPMLVKRILRQKNGDLYPVCPRCQLTLEREFMLYCDRCGQCLDWRKYRNAEVCEPVEYMI